VGRVFRLLTTPLDRLALWSARSGQADHGGCPHAAEARKLLEGADFFCSGLAAPAEPRFASERDFCFNSRWRRRGRRTTIVPGKLHRAGKAWREKPAVILLHGWNGEAGLSLAISIAGLATGAPRRQRRDDRIAVSWPAKTAGSGRHLQFISRDLLRMVEATRQAIATRGPWPPGSRARFAARGLVGILDGRLAGGLVAGHDPRAAFAVLLTPIARLDGPSQNWPFASRSARASRTTAIRFDALNLRAHFPFAGPEILCSSNPPTISLHRPIRSKNCGAPGGSRKYGVCLTATSAFFVAADHGTRRRLGGPPCDPAREPLGQLSKTDGPQ